MTIRFGADRLRALAERSDVIGRAELLEAIAAHPIEATATTTVGAEELLPTYTMRLERWRDEGLPPSSGLPEFVDALRGLGKDQVVITRVQSTDATFVLLFSVGPEVLRACVAIKRPMDMTESGF